MQNKITEYIFTENKIEKKDEGIYNKFIKFFFDTNIMNNQEWDLNVYKNYTNIFKQNLFPNNEKLEGLDEATNLFNRFIQGKKEIYILTDNDLDGTSANSIAKCVKIYIERRYKKTNLFNVQFAYGTSHGISFKHIDSLLDGKQEEFLIITADNGINNREEIEKIKNKYPLSKIIITDHHKANAEDHVFNLVDVVVNPESIALNKVSKRTQLKVGDKFERTSISGGHTFFLLIESLLKKLKIKNQALSEELELIALFSNIGDIINYNLDIHNNIAYNFPNFEKKMYLFKSHIANLSRYDVLPNNDYHSKMRNFFILNNTTFNAVRRLNSLLMNVNNFSNEGDLKRWFQEYFELDTDSVKINEKTLSEYIFESNRKAKQILLHFNDSVEIKDNFYSYIKNIVPYALMSDNSYKTEKDSVYIAEVIEIIKGFNELKKILRTHIIEKELYSTYKEESFEVYYSKKGSILREILSIQVFIESKDNIPFLNLASTTDQKEKKGSLRTPAFFPLKAILLGEKTFAIRDKYKILIKILGHTEAAGINFTKSDNSILTEKELFAFLKEIYVVLEAEMKAIKLEKELPKDYVAINLEEFSKINSTTFKKVINEYLYIGIHPMFKLPKIKVKLSDLEKLFQEELKMQISKKNNKYFSKKIGNLTIMYFGNEKELKKSDKVFYGTFNLKYDNYHRKEIIEIILND